MSKEWRDKAGARIGTHWLRVVRGWSSLTSLFTMRWLRIKYRAPTSLASRVLLLQIVWAVLFGMLVIGSLWWGSTKVIEESFLRQGEGWIKKLDELATPLYLSEDKDYFSETLDYLKNFYEIASVEYYDESGKKLLAKYHRDGHVAAKAYNFSKAELKALHVIDPANKPQLFTGSDDGSMFHISAPIWIKSVVSDGMFDFSLDEPANEKVKVIGLLRVGLDYSRYQKTLNHYILLGSVVIGMLLFVAALVGRVMIRWGLRPLMQLEEPLNRLAQGETDVEVHSSGDHEIAQIGKVLNSTISALKERDETLRRMANHDPLTGLINRNYFRDELEEELRRIELEGGSSALFFIDLDRFKFINDTYGHAAGDRLLVAVARLLKQRMREGDLIGRFGGDEFTALVRGVDQRQARDIAADLLKLMQEFRFQEAGDPLQIFFSIGITVFDASLPSAHDVFLQADAAVHEAKGRGRNRYHLFEHTVDSGNIAPDRGWYERLSRVLEEHTLVLYYQPLVALAEGGERIYEVLLRLPNGDREVLRPSAFFPEAERFGLMAEMDRQVIRKAVQWLAGQRDPHLVLSINLSLQSFDKAQELIEYLTAVVEEYAVETRQLMFEVDEAVAVRNSEKICSLMEQINALGYRFAIDNFGAGYASFEYLKHSPAGFLNIDPALIQGMVKEPVNQVTVRAIVESAQLLGKKTVAKYVNDELVMQQLKKYGVDYAQGNFLCAAQPLVDKAAPVLMQLK